MVEVAVLKKTKTKGENYFRIIYRKGIDHYYGKYDLKHPTNNEADFWNFNKIHPEWYCPKDTGTLTIAPDPTPRGGYVKFPRYNFDKGSRDHSDMRYLRERFLREAMVCERILLLHNLHLATYHGVMVKNGLVRAICYSGYETTLEQHVNPEGYSKMAFRYGRYGKDFTIPDRRRLLDQIENGIRHLHSLNLVHNDLKPANICLRRDKTAVIIDFDSCVPVGESLNRVGRTEGWHDPRVTIAQTRNDLEAIDEIDEWLSDNEVKRYRFSNKGY